MSPVARSSGHAGRALLVATASVVVLMAGLLLAAVLFAGQNSSRVGLGDQTFQGGDARRLAKEIKDRGPIYYSDVSGERSRDLILQHLGRDPDRGWFAFRAQPPSKPRDCTWQWQPERRRFRASCLHSLTAPADGRGLERYPVKVLDGSLDIDLNAVDRSTTTAPAPTTTTVAESGDRPPG